MRAPSPAPAEFRVRQQTSGYTGRVTFIVVSVRDGRTRRVSMHAEPVRETAQAAADALNAAAELHRANLTDPNWVARRDQVLAGQDRTERARSAAFERLIAAQAAQRAARGT